MKKILIIAIILFVFKQICFSQLCLTVIDENNKLIKKYSEGDYISFYQNEKKLNNDTIVETFIEGSIVTISKDSLKINFVSIEKEYYKDNNLIYSKIYNADENSDLSCSFPIYEISALYKGSKTKLFGAALVTAGLATFAIAPVASMNFSDLDYFNTGNYIITAALGIAFGITGLILNKVSKDKYLRINNSIPCQGLIIKAKIINCTINVVDENQTK